MTFANLLSWITMHRALAILVTLFISNEAIAKTSVSYDESCLQDAIFATVDVALDDILAGNEIHITVENVSDMAIGGVAGRLSLVAEGRPLPLANGIFSSLTEISGGLLRGETVTGPAWLYLDEREKVLARDAPNFELRLRITDLADGELKRALWRETWILGWGDDYSDSFCSELDPS